MDANPRLAVFLETIWSGEDQALDEGRTIPSFNICSNTILTTCRRSGARYLGRADTGGPVVWMWWVMLCVTGVFGEQT